MADIPADAVGSMGGPDFPKGGIGNYKGVMLCNRPDELGGKRTKQRTGKIPFYGMVDHKVPLG